MPENTQEDWEEFTIQWAGGGTYPQTFKTAADALSLVSYAEKVVEDYGIANLEYTIIKRERKTIVTDWEPVLVVANEAGGTDGDS